MAQFYFSSLYYGYLLSAIYLVYQIFYVVKTNSSYLNVNLKKLGFSWSFELGLIKSENFNPGNDTKNYLKICLIKALLYPLLSVLGILFLVMDTYQTYSKYWHLVDSKNSYQVLKSIELPSKSEVLIHAFKTFAKETSSKSEIKEHFTELLKVIRSDSNHDQDKFFNDMAEELKPSVFFTDEMKKTLRTVAGNDPYLMNIETVLLKLDPYSSWEKSFLIYAFENTSVEILPSLSSTIARILCKRINKSSYSTQDFSNPLTDSEIQIVEDYVKQFVSINEMNEYKISKSELIGRGLSNNNVLSINLITTIVKCDFNKLPKAA